jgi:hypothetical protein
MKKIIYAGAFMLACNTVITSRAQAPEFPVNAEKKELKQEKKQLAQEEKVLRREEKTMRHNEVSYMTREQFKEDFPDAQAPSFYAGKQFNEVFFILDGKQFTAYYNTGSKLAGTITPKQFGDLPWRTQENINHHYLDKGYILSRVILYNDNETVDSDMFLYESPFEDHDTYFVELLKDGNMTVLQVDMDGNVSFFKKL